jgi:hypothetical protein
VVVYVRNGAIVQQEEIISSHSDYTVAVDCGAIMDVTTQNAVVYKLELNITEIFRGTSVDFTPGILLWRDRLL